MMKTLALVLALSLAAAVQGLVKVRGSSLRIHDVHAQLQLTSVRSPPVHESPRAMSLRGGNDERDVLQMLRDLLSRREGSGPSLQDLIMEAMQRLRPTTRALLIINVLCYLFAKVGLLGKDPAASLGISPDRILLYPMREGHRLLTGIFLHLNHAHLVSNMLALAALGNKVEDRIGSFKFALLVSLLIPSVGLAHVSTTVLLNAVGSLLGFKDTRQVQLGGFLPRASVHQVVRRLVMHQISLTTVSIGFSGILFALNAIGTEMFAGGSLFCFPLSDLPPEIRLYVVKYLRRYIEKRWGSPRLCIPSYWAPYLQVIISQLADPLRVSLCGHLAGAIAASVVQTPWNFLSLRHTRRELGIFLKLLPAQLLLLALGRRALEAARRDSVTEWGEAVKDLWRTYVRRRRAPEKDVGGERRGIPDLWDATGGRVKLVGLRREQELNGLDGTVVAIDEVTGRLLVRLHGMKREISVSPQNVIRAIRPSRSVNPRAWTVSQVGDWLRSHGHAEEALLFERSSMTGSSLLEMSEERLRRMGISNGPRRRQILEIIDQQFGSTC
mmetsp:Transcript_31493/g.100785  ORF Transcript_31493/g.100785 Transcript_31493/m.100785 type:complete len:554 (+) Transcript_31493:181-1842(+)